MALISTNCYGCQERVASIAQGRLACNLLRSLQNCWKPSSSVMNVVDNFEAVQLLDCVTRFLSSNVRRRSLSYKISTSPIVTA